VVVIGPGAELTDDAGVEDYEAMITNAFATTANGGTSNGGTSNGGTSNGGEEGEHTGIGAATQPFKGVVFMAGCSDKSAIGEMAFSRCVLAMCSPFRSLVRVCVRVCVCVYTYVGRSDRWRPSPPP
jgi:hypothetical protein